MPTDRLPIHWLAPLYGQLAGWRVGRADFTIWEMPQNPDGSYFLDPSPTPTPHFKGRCPQPCHYRDVVSGAPQERLLMDGIILFIGSPSLLTPKTCGIPPSPIPCPFMLLTGGSRSYTPEATAKTLAVLSYGSVGNMECLHATMLFISMIIANFLISWLGAHFLKVGQPRFPIPSPLQKPACRRLCRRHP
eukprot:GGOE01029505.1.p2 GENE.GGOE01029505.1~~GGOE01029505.1.p2  ORF type:complete len:190 (-),score=0.83 GGOE01029505.1:83-652(-)